MIRVVTRLHRNFASKKKLKSIAERDTFNKAAARHKVTEVSAEKLPPLITSRPYEDQLPTKIFKWSHLPILAMTAYEVYTKSELDKAAISTFYTEVIALHSVYYSYFYFVVFYRNKKLRDLSKLPNLRAFLKRISWVAPTYLSFILLAFRDPSININSVLLLGAIPFFSSVITDMISQTTEKEAIHEDRFIKSFVSFLMMLISICITFYSFNQRMKEAEIEHKLQTYQMRNEQYIDKQRSMFESNAGSSTAT